MAIRPVDMSGIINRSQDISTIKHNEDNKGLVDQNNFQNQFNRELNQHMKQVRDPSQSENPRERFDAKEKGKNQYSGQKRGKKKKQEDSGGEKGVAKSRGGFDVKI